MALTIDEKKAIIAYRIQKSAQTMIEARDNASLKHWSLAAIDCIMHYFIWHQLYWSIKVICRKHIMVSYAL